MGYIVAKRMITLGRVEGLLNRVNKMYLVGQLTDDQYTELVGLLTPESGE